jgi:hypothetical protein
MSATNNPFGLKPVFHTSGLDRAVPFTGTISTTANIYQYSPVKLVSGALTIMADTDTQVYGVVDGFEFTDAQGRRTVSKWFGSALGTTSDEVAWVWTDPQIVYEIQATGSLNAAAVGTFKALSNAGSGQTIGNGGLGQSTAALNPGTVAAGTDAPVIVVGLGREEGNDWGDSYTIVQVKLADQTVSAPIPNPSS